MKKNIKMISFDLDGTIVKNEDVSEKTIIAFKILKEKGIKLICNTGRSIQSLEKFYKKLNLLNEDDISILTTGSTIQKNLSKEIIYHTYLTLDDYFKIKENLNAKYSISVYTPNEIFYVDEIFDEIKKDNEVLKMPIFKFDENKEIEISRINIMGKKDILDDFIENHNKDFLKDYYFVRTIDISIEIFNKKASKGNTLNMLMEKYGINKDEIMTIGDSNNDLTMFKDIKYSVAMDNASDFVKSHANYITDSIDNDGFYNICEKFGLLE